MRRRRRLLFSALAVLVVAAAAGVVIHVVTEPTPAELRAAALAAERARLMRHERRDVAAAERLVAPPLPTTAGATAPSGATGLFRSPLRAHEVVGFVPYWEISALVPADYADAGTLCYFGPTLTATGSFTDTDPEFHTTVFTSFVTSAHAAGDAVYLTVSSADDAVIDKALRHPSASGATLADAVATTLQSDDLDGVDLDVEGTEASERGSYVTFVRAFTAHLHDLRPAEPILVDAYVDAAGEGSASFFDVASLAKYSTAIFVMGYDMYGPGRASANAPLIAPDLGLSDVQALLAYRLVVPANKLILGVPFYGYDFATDSSRANAPADGSPDSIVYSQIGALSSRAVWDPTTETVFSRYTKAGHTHEIWYDNPVSVALKTALAQVLGLRGVGAWALGMEGDDPTMLEALTGGTAPLRGASG